MRRRRELMAMQSDLPSAYQRVEYLESSGTQYIYTDISASSGIECEADIAWTGTQNDASAFGGRKSTSDRMLLIHQYPSNKWTFGYGSGNSGLGTLVPNTKYHVKAKAVIGDQYLQIDGQTIYTGTSNDEISNNFNMAIFGTTYGSATKFRLLSSARVYGLSVKMNGVPAANFIPCIRKSDSEAGMYDTVSKTFYTNAGTGEFIIPPNEGE